MIKKTWISALAILLTYFAYAQEKLTYQKPPQEILTLVDAPLAPSVLLDDKGEYMVMLYRDQYKSIVELSEDEMRLAGLRINPKTNIGSRTTYYNNVELKKAMGDDVMKVQGLPENARLANFRWSPNQEMIALTNTTTEGVEVWLLNIAEAKVTKLTEPKVNANMGNPIDWFADNSALLVKMLSSKREPLINTGEAVPDGPTISLSEGEKAQNRTYQDLLKNRNDEHNFEQLALSELYKVSLDGKATEFLASAMYDDVTFSPDGEYLMISTIKKPFSYLVPYYRFPFEANIYDSKGELIQQVNDVPLQEVMPKGFMAERTGRRNMSWRNDKPSTLIYVKALDEGDPEIEVDHRDELFLLDAPFDGEGESLFKTINRYAGVYWGSDNVAVVIDYWWNTRNTKNYLIDPSNPEKEAKILFDRNYQDRYSDPGSYVTAKNEFNKPVLAIDDNSLYLMGEGFSEKGQFPFVDQLSLTSLETERLYQSDYTDKLESLQEAIDINKGEILVRIESSSKYPNYYVRNINKNDKLTQITDFENPFKSLQDVHKEVITYKRDDGLELDATLYLPVGYDKENKEKLPMIVWAYPREFKDKSSASQVTSNPNEFTYPWYGSPLYWLTKGYVVLDDAAFPIVGEGEEEPNDSFRKQLVANAYAAINAVDEMGYIDKNRVAVGGHSYGAFMVANLLSHSNLFAAGIARSGAYNRTLTPFGFQSEERNYWEAPEVYYSMSPFMHADKMKTPLLLVHGEADNNSGTYPLQSERYFNALKGLGATARLVMLPKESHGYRAKESILHMLWEQDRWLDRYVKNKGSEVSTPEVDSSSSE